MIYGIEVLIGIGCGTNIQAGYAVIQLVVEPAMMSYAITFMMVAQILGITLGLSSLAQCLSILPWTLFQVRCRCRELSFSLRCRG